MLAWWLAVRVAPLMEVLVAATLFCSTVPSGTEAPTVASIDTGIGVPAPWRQRSPICADVRLNVTTWPETVAPAGLLDA